MSASKKGYSKARVVQTVKDSSDRLTEKNVISFEPVIQDKIEQIQILPETKYQEIIGFGGAFTEAGGFILSSVNKEIKEQILNAYFHPIHGINYTICRTHMNSCDFSLSNYSCDDVPGDSELKYFNIDRDKKYLIPFIKEAKKIAGGQLKLFISPWSPPYWMKTSGDMNHGGKLKPNYRDAWALFFSKFIKMYHNESIDIWGLTVQNEPEATQRWDSCRYTVEEERDFVRDYLGPRLKKDKLDHVKVIVWDHNRDLMYKRAKTILSDAEAAKYVWGVGFHWYSGEEFENVGKTHDSFPDKNLIFTEGCIERGVILGAWDRGERYAHHMIGDLSHWTNAWVDWNLILDIEGGPNHASNFCDAPIIVDYMKNKLYFQNSYYYLGHFSKFIQPGAARVESRNQNKSLETIAFQNPDQSLAVIVLNRTDKQQAFQVVYDGRSFKYESLPHSILTFILEP